MYKTSRFTEMPVEGEELEFTGYLEDFFFSPVPENLWHYTSVAALQGILASQTIWATEVHFTKDASEFIHSREVATALLDRIIPKTEDESRMKVAGKSIVEQAFEKGALAPHKADIFIASFSSSEDCKSQWVDYGAGSCGVSIRFDLRSVRPGRGIGSAITLAPCVYELPEKEKMLQLALIHFMEVELALDRSSKSKPYAFQEMMFGSIVDRIFHETYDLEKFKATVQKKFESRLYKGIVRSSYDLLRVASHLKDDYYREEKEWRLVLPYKKPLAGQESKILFREPDATPYLAHNLFHERLPITGVMLGPSCTDEAIVRKLLEEAGLDVPVTRSKARIRGALRAA